MASGFFHFPINFDKLFTTRMPGMITDSYFPDRFGKFVHSRAIMQYFLDPDGEINGVPLPRIDPGIAENLAVDRIVEYNRGEPARHIIEELAV